MRLEKILFTVVIVVLLSACGGGGSSSSNNTPTVNAGVDKSVKVNETITITGTANDSDGSIVAYEWREGSKFLANTATFDYLPTVAGNHTLTLTVTDDDGVTVSDSVIVTVTGIISTLSDGLIAHYKFDGNANDSSGNGNDGVEYGGVSYVDGVIGKAFNAKVENKAYLQLENTFDSNSLKSLSFWIYQYGKHNLDSGQILLSKYNWTDRHSFIFTTYNNNDDTNCICASFYIELSDGTDKSDSICSYYEKIPDDNQLTVYKNKQMDINKWTYVTYKDDGEYMYLYIDSELVAKRKRSYQTYFNSDEPVNIGYEDYIGGDFSYNDYLNAKIDDLRIYNRALNESEIQELYNLKQN